MSAILSISWTNEHRLRANQLRSQGLTYKETPKRLTEQFKLPFSGEGVRWQFRSGLIDQFDNKPGDKSKKQFDFHDEGNNKVSSFQIRSLKPIQIPNVDINEILDKRKNFTKDE